MFQDNAQSRANSRRQDNALLVIDFSSPSSTMASQGSSMNLIDLPSAPLQSLQPDDPAEALVQALEQSWEQAAYRWPMRKVSSYETVPTSQGSLIATRFNLLPAERLSWLTCDTANPHHSTETSPYYTPPPCVCTRALADLEELWMEKLCTMRQQFLPSCGTASQSHDPACRAEELQGELLVLTDRAKTIADEYDTYLGAIRAFHERQVRTRGERQKHLALVDQASADDESHWPMQLCVLRVEESAADIAPQTADTLPDQQLYQ